MICLFSTNGDHAIAETITDALAILPFAKAGTEVFIHVCPEGTRVEEWRFIRPTGTPDTVLIGRGIVKKRKGKELTMELLPV